MKDLAAYLDFVDHPAIARHVRHVPRQYRGADPIAAIGDLGKHMIHVHISENDRGVPGRGHVPWKETFKALKKSGYDGWLHHRGLRPRPAGARRRDARMAGFFGRARRRSIARDSGPSETGWRRA